MTLQIHFFSKDGFIFSYKRIKSSFPSIFEKTSFDSFYYCFFSLKVLLETSVKSIPRITARTTRARTSGSVATRLTPPTVCVLLSAIILDHSKS